MSILRPWEANQGAGPWMQGFIYPRTLTITRPAATLAVGNVGYIGQTRQTETVIFTAIPASIQAGRMGNSRRNDGKIAADAPGPVVWNIWIPLFALANGSVNDRDIVADDLGLRYIVGAAYWNSLGTKLETIRLEA